MFSLQLLACLLPCVLSSPPPNIVVILADDLGFHDVPWHNTETLVAPSLTALSREGVVLEQHYSQSVCSPSRAALLTGRYAINTGLHTGALPSLVPGGLRTDLATLPQLLSDAGYSTWVLGKWHLGMCSESFWPNRRGFDHFHGMLGGAADYYSHRTDDPPVHIPGYDYRLDSEVDVAASGTYSTKLIRDDAVSVILGHNSTKPLFLYLPFQAPHGPLMVDSSYQDLYSDIPSQDRQKYLGMVTALDQAVGDIVQALKTGGLYDNSILLFLSDNGAPVGGWPGYGGSDRPLEYGGANFPLRGGKLTLWEGGTRTPALILAPNTLSPRIESSVVHLADWLPTLLAATGLEAPTGLDGLSMWDRLRDPSLPSPRTEMVYNINLMPPRRLPGVDQWPPIAALRQGDWKYVWRTYGYDGWARPAEMGLEAPYPPPADVRHKLYNLAVDPLEEEDLSEDFPEVAATMLAMLQQLHAAMGREGNATRPPQDQAGRPELQGGYWGAGWC